MKHWDRQPSLELRDVLTEMRLMRHELSSVRQQTATALRVLSTLLRDLHAVRTDETTIRSALEDIAAHLSPPPTNQDDPPTLCHVCGSHLTAHPAPAGTLLICPVCGASEFVDARNAPCEAHGIPQDPPRSVCAPPSGWTTTDALGQGR